MAKELRYGSAVEWSEKKKGIITFPDKAKGQIEVAVAPEFMGHGGIVTPEDLFVSSVNTCMMSYFLNVCAKMRAKFVNYTSQIEGVLIEKGIDFVFSTMHISITVIVADESNEKKIRRAIDMARDGCFIANSLKTDIAVSYNVVIMG